MHDLFFELIRVAIGTQDSLSYIPKPAEWQMLYKMAKKQSLVGVCFAGIQQVLSTYPLRGEDPSVIGMPEMLYFTWMGVAAKIQQRNEVVNRQCVELQQRLSADGYRSYIMKGQANAALYKIRDERVRIDDLHLLRQSGDIDVYLEGGLKEVLAYAKTFGDVVHVNELEMSVPVFQDTEVEFHYRPLIMRNPIKNWRLQRFFESCAEKNFAHRVSLGDAGEICAPTTEFNLVHQLVHIHLHLFTEGIGMRQLMDYYFVLKNLSVSPLNGECFESVKEVISDLELERFASAMMWVLGHIFGLEREKMIWGPNQKDGELLLNEVMTGGNFGRHNQEQNYRKSKIGYSVWALFFRNLKLSRFDRSECFWGPVWRISHRLTRKII